VATAIRIAARRMMPVVILIIWLLLERAGPRVAVEVEVLPQVQAEV
jgi:hypothetical protein